MTTQTEALKLAYEELKHIKAWCLRRTGIGLVDENVLAKVEEALANHIEDNLTMVAQPEQQSEASKPLTDEQIQECWYRTQGEAENFARAIEAAHGIKE